MAGGGVAINVVGLTCWALAAAALRRETAGGDLVSHVRPVPGR